MQRQVRIVRFWSLIVMSLAFVLWHPEWSIMLPPLLYFPGQAGCFCCAGCSCIRCESGTTPCSFQAVIQDVADGTCASCDFWNGTFALDEFAEVGIAGQAVCQWTYSDSPPCSLSEWLLTIYRTGGGAAPPDPPDPTLARRSYLLTYNGQTVGSLTDHWFGKVSPPGSADDKTTCQLSNENIPPVTFATPTPRCDITIASCLLTAL